MPQDNGGQHALRIRALMGDDFEARGTLRGKLLATARCIRAHRAWITEGCYAWWRLTGDLQAVQREMRKELWGREATDAG